MPTNSRVKSLPDSTTNQYIDFTHTDMDADAAQTTIPYLDAQDVISIPPCPISGKFEYLTSKTHPHTSNREPFCRYMLRCWYLPQRDFYVRRLRCTQINNVRLFATYSNTTTVRWRHNGGIGIAT